MDRGGLIHISVLLSLLMFKKGAFKTISDTLVSKNIFMEKQKLEVLALPRALFPGKA